MNVAVPNQAKYGNPATSFINALGETPSVHSQTPFTTQNNRVRLILVRIELKNATLDSFGLIRASYFNEHHSISFANKKRKYETKLIKADFKGLGKKE